MKRHLIELLGRLSVRRSLALAIIPMSVLGALAAGLVAAILSTHEVAQYHIRAGEQIAASLAQRSDLPLLYQSTIGISEIAASYFDNPLITEIRVVGKNGSLLFSKSAGPIRNWEYPQPPKEETAISELDDAWLFSRQVRTSQPRLADPYMPEAALLEGVTDEVLGEVQVALGKETLFQTRRNIFFANMFAALGFSLLAVGVTFLMVHRFIRPLETLAESMHDARTRHWTVTPTLEGPREIRDIGESYQALMTTLREREEQLQGFNEDLEDRIRQRTHALEAANKELEAFSYSASHDLRAPLRAIDGFGKALQEDYGSSLDPTALGYLGRMRAGASRMSELIDDMLKLSRITRYEIQLAEVDMSEMAEAIALAQRERTPERNVEFLVMPNMTVRADRNLLHIALENLIENAWKYTGKVHAARIEFGRKNADGEVVYILRDNGAGFDMRFADKLFGAFQRLHGKEFEGTGIGLAIVQRILVRHGGRIWARAEVDKGATFYFTLPD